MCTAHNSEMYKQLAAKSKDQNREHIITMLLPRYSFVYKVLFVAQKVMPLLVTEHHPVGKNYGSIALGLPCSCCPPVVRLAWSQRLIHSQSGGCWTGSAQLPKRTAVTELPLNISQVAPFRRRTVIWEVLWRLFLSEWSFSPADILTCHSRSRRCSLLFPI